ncbi:GntR family transcriptional regulator [Candidatus Bipolaricaulota bacterium]|nr:GntR family transcriptional regulator [Candidatus Bipolaricaulota bacterium]
MASNNIGKLQKKLSLADQVYGTLRDAILQGRLRPCEQLNQVELASALGVSDRTVREALTRLIAEGLVSRTPYKAFRVIGVTAEEIEEIVQMRIMLEGWAMELAAPHINKDELDQMRKLVSQMEDEGIQQFAATFQGTNRDFHWIAIRACRKEHLTDMLKRLWDLMLPYALVGEDSEPTAGTVRAEAIGSLQLSHHQLIAHLEARDGLAARNILAQHIGETMEQLRMAVKRGNRLQNRENGRLFLRRLLPIKASPQDV